MVAQYWCFIGPICLQYWTKIICSWAQAWCNIDIGHYWANLGQILGMVIINMMWWWMHIRLWGHVIDDECIDMQCGCFELSVSWIYQIVRTCDDECIDICSQHYNGGPILMFHWPNMLTILNQDHLLMGPSLVQYWHWPLLGQPLPNIGLGNY